jgi:hypothetical protein
MAEIPYVRQPVDFSTPVRYAYGPDSYPQPGVSNGTIHKLEWTASRVFPGTDRVTGPSSVPASLQTEI